MNAKSKADKEKVKVKDDAKVEVEVKDDAKVEERPGKGPIVAAVDFSDDAGAALALAAEMAAAQATGLVVIHVAREHADVPGVYKRTKRDLLRPMDEVAKKALAAYLDQVEGVDEDVLKDADIRVAKGGVVKRILEAARDTDARMVVVGKHGNSDLHDFVKGSKVVKLIRKSDVPVLVVKGRT